MLALVRRCALREGLGLLAVIVLLLGCGIHAPWYRPTPGTPEVIVHPFGTSQARGDYTGPTDFGRLFAEYLAGALQEQGVRAVVEPADAPIPPGVAQVIDGELTRLDPGSWNLRFWIGF